MVKRINGIQDISSRKKIYFSRQIVLLTVIFIFLCVIGMINLSSAGADSSHFNNQLRHMGIGFLAFCIIGWFIPLHMLNTYAYLLYGIVLASLIAVLVLGHSAGGAKRWLNLGAFGVQPSEFAKLTISFFVAKYFYNNRNAHTYELKDLFPLFFAIGLYFVLIFVQPDFGTAGMCVLIAMAQVAFIRFKINIKTIAGLAGFASIAGVLGWLFFLRPYQKLRILNLINPDLDPMGSGYNSLQSLVAIGSGRMFGKGLFKGTQTQLQFLPARHTDFIFSVFAEEQGYLGVTIIFLLFSSIAYIALNISREAKDTFNALLAIGVVSLIYVEFAINIAMVFGMFPVVGVPLPFFSYGGTALLTVCVALGLLVAIERDRLESAAS